MALPDNLKLKVNIDDLRADPDIIQDYKDSIQAILDNADGKKLVDIDTLRAYDKALKGSDVGEAFDTLKEIQMGIETEAATREQADIALNNRINNLENIQDTTYDFAATENPLEFIVISSKGESQTVTLIAPSEKDPTFKVATQDDINILWNDMGLL